MRKLLTSIFACLAGTLTMSAIEDNTVEVIFNGTSATVNIANNISSYVTNQSGSSSHVKLVQSESFSGINASADNEDGEIIYVLSGSTSNGEFYLEGAFKCTVELSGVSITNPSGPAINVQNGKRVSVSIKKSTTNTLTDGANEDYNGAFHSKGHTKFKGKGTLNVVGNSKHGIYSKEYLEIKNCNINITKAVKDGIHCKEYFFMESGNVSISGAGDDGIQVELSGNASTGAMPQHEEEDSGNFYMANGTLTISDYEGKAIVADGTITYSGGTQNFDTSDTKILAGIEDIQASKPSRIQDGIYDLQGRKLQAAPQHRCIYIIVENGQAKKVIRK
jgi:hypothetical protein